MTRFLLPLLYGVVSIICFVAWMVAEPSAAFFVVWVGFGIASLCQGIIRGFRLDEYRQRLDRVVIVAGCLVGVAIVVVGFLLAMRAMMAEITIKE